MNAQKTLHIRCRLPGMLLMAAVLCAAEGGEVQADQESYENIYISQCTSSVPVPQTLIAVGYGRSSSRPGYSGSQEKLMALRAAKLDAYRTLSSALRELSPQATGPDAMITTDGFIRGAFLIREQALDNNRYAVEMGVPLKNFQPQILKRFKVYDTPFVAQQNELSYEEWKDWIK